MTDLFSDLPPPAPPIEAGAGAAVTFDGPDLTRADHARLGEQLERVRAVMEGGAWWTPEELERATGYRWASISARIRDIRKPKFFGRAVERRRVGGGQFAYRLVPAGGRAEGGAA